MCQNPLELPAVCIFSAQTMTFCKIESVTSKQW